MFTVIVGVAVAVEMKFSTFLKPNFGSSLVKLQTYDLSRKRLHKSGKFAAVVRQNNSKEFQRKTFNGSKR